MASPEKGKTETGKVWRRCRTCFRWLRRSALFLILCLLLAVLYFNQVGVPEFIKDPLLEKLRARGIELQFDRLRLRFGRGLVAENVKVGPNAGAAGPRLQLRQVQLRLNPLSLFKGQVQVDSLLLHKGTFAWPVASTNGAPRELLVENIETELRLLPDDRWELAEFHARFAGARFQLSGIVTNASAARGWKWVQGRRPAAPGTLQARLQKLADTLEKIHFQLPPQLDMDVRGDARDLQSFSVRVSVFAPDAETPWGTLQRGLLSAQLLPAAEDASNRGELNLQADFARTRWATATNLALQLDFFAAAQGSNLVHAALNIEAAQVETRWGKSTNLQFRAEWLHPLTNAVPLSGQGELKLADASTRWGTCRELEFQAALAAPTNDLPAMNETWSFWTNLAPYVLSWTCRATEIDSPKLAASELTAVGHWRAPHVSAEEFLVKLYGGQLHATLGLDVGSRQFTFSGSSDFDGLKILPLLTPGGQRWLRQFTWNKSPLIKARGSLTLPAWTNRQPNWRTEVRPTVKLQGQFHVEDGTFRGIPAATADGQFFYENMTWLLPDLVATRSDGRVNLYHESNDLTKDYYFKFQSTIDILTLRSLVPPAQQKFVDLLSLAETPVIDGEVWGRWRQRDLIGARARVAVTNFAWRGQQADGLQAVVEYTNRYLTVIEPRVQRGLERLSASLIGVDFSARRIFITNGFSTADPLAVARAIGPKIGQHAEKYRFLQPPTARVEGVFPFRYYQGADAHFQVEGGPFEWWRFKVPHIGGKIDWVGEKLFLHDVKGDLYRGQAQGRAEFLFRTNRSADLRFEVAITNADIHALAQDLSGKTNRLEGLLSGKLIISDGNTTNWQTLFGGGQMQLRDGLIWDIPLFGVLSPVLETIAPGLGNSRAREASATFVITNGVIRSEDLELGASTMRVQYRGTVDLKGNVNARVEAELLRDTWVVGRVLSLALWPVTKIFEYQITGTLSQPKSEPVYFIPKVIMFPLHPIRTMREFAPDESPASPAPALPPAAPVSPRNPN